MRVAPMAHDTDKPQKNRYRKIEVRMWGDEKFRELSAPKPCGQSLWVYLLTGPHTGPIPGLFRAGRLAMAEELNWDPEAFQEAFQEVFQQGMAKADWQAKVVWIPKAILCNRPESPNVVLSWGSEWELIPECDLKREAFEVLQASICGLGEAYAKAFARAFAKPNPKPSGKPSPKAIGNQEQEQEQEQKQDRTPLSAGADQAGQSGALALVPDDPPPVESKPDDVQTIFAYWQDVMASPRSVLDDKRRKVIEGALKSGYTPRDLCQAIRGCSKTPHNMGRNDRNQKYNGLDVILRSADQIDRFIENDRVNPALAGGHAGGAGAVAADDQRAATNAAAKALLFGPARQEQAHA